MKILIADDHSVVRTGLKYVLENLADEITILEAVDFTQVKQCVNSQPDIELIILDLAMPGVNNLEAITELRDIVPAIPIVIFSASEDPQTIVESIEKGAQGFIPKSSHREIVVEALLNVLAGYVYIPTELLEKSNGLSPMEGDWNYRDPAQRALVSEKPVLTHRQREVLLLICRGVSNKKIAESLSLSLPTVKTHIMHLFKSLGVSNRSQAAYKARAAGILRDENINGKKN